MTEPAGAAPETHLSPALAELLGDLPTDRRAHVLDLGPAVGSNIAFFGGRFLCSVEVVDLFGSFDGSVRRSVAADGDPTDLALLWDGLNYLDRDQIRELAALLAERCPPGAGVFAMVATNPEMPREPGTYPIRWDGSKAELLYRGNRQATRPAPRYRPAEIDQMFEGFRVDRNFLLRHGVQEYLLVREG